MSHSLEAMRNHVTHRACESPSSLVIKRHGIGTRLWHWVNLICLVILLMSGLQIFNAHPALYWGDQSTFDKPLLWIHAIEKSGVSRGITQVSGYEFDTTGILGLSQEEGESQARAFPSWATIPGDQWLSMGRNWHFLAAWVFAPSVFIYLIYILLRRYRSLFPNIKELKDIPYSIADHSRFRFHHSRHYNVLQKLTYIVVLFVLLPVMIMTGLTMSPFIDTAFPFLPELFGGRQSARTIHFICAFSLVGFAIIHVALVVVSGPFNNLRSMITGRYRIDDDLSLDQEAHHD